MKGGFFDMARSIRGWRSVILLVMAILAASTGFSQEREKANQVYDAFTADINDSIQVDVKLRYDEAGLPEHYFCHVDTPVCEEGLCKLMVIDIYWDVLGNFLKYELSPGEPLTKFDHLHFTEEDHAKLKAILADRASILRDYPVNDLVDQRIVKKSDVVDAVTAATRVGVRDAIVSGAVYSTYTLWHIVNGPIASRIEQHSKPLYSDALLMKMFRSENLHYQYFALHHYPEKDSLLYLPEVINLVKAGIDYVPYFAIEKVPHSAWLDHSHQLNLITHFRRADFELQNAILDKVSDVNLSSQALDVLMAALNGLTDKQRLKVLQVAARNQKRLSKDALAMIETLCGHSDPQISVLARGLVEGGN